MYEYNIVRVYDLNIFNLQPNLQPHPNSDAGTGGIWCSNSCADLTESRQLSNQNGLVRSIKVLHTRTFW